MESSASSVKKYCVLCQNISACELLHRAKKTISTNREGEFSPVAHDFGIYSDILKCLECGHIFADSNPKENIVEKYEMAEDPGSYFKLWEYRETNCDRAIKKALRFCPDKRPLRVLDIGAGGGIVVRHLQKLGHQVIGVEPSRALVKMAMEKMGVSLYSGTLEQFLKNGDSFDLVCMLEVIEHLQSPEKEIERIGTLLKPGGILLITTPNIKSFSAKLLGTKWWSFRRMHLHYFSPNTLKELARKFCFHMVYKGIFMKTFPLSYYLQNLGLPCSRIPQINFTASLGDMTVIFKKTKQQQ